MFKGSMVALVTPMTNGEVDVSQLCDLVEFHIENGTNALVAAGTTGEAATLSDKEKFLVIKTVVDHVNERLPVIAGTAANSTKHTIELSLEAMELGADATLIMTPAYIKPTQEGLYQHYKAIANAVAIPQILYNVPGRTACDMLSDTVCRLADISNIIGIKEATGDLSRHQAIVEGCGDKLDIYSGDDFTAHELLLNGAKGIISVTANVAPSLMSELCQLGLAHDKSACEALQKQLMPLHEALCLESNPIPAKWAVHKLGLINDEIRLPLTPLTVAHQNRVVDAMKQLKLIG